MAYEELKYLSNLTASDKVLRVKLLILIKI